MPPTPSKGLNAQDLIQAPQAHIRAILLSLCQDPSTRRIALTKLTDLQAFDTPQNALKRKLPQDVFICLQCDKPFSYEDNSDKCCSYHPEDCELNEEAEIWETVGEGDEDLDQDWIGEEWPQGFVHPCCDAEYKSSGCVVAKHEAHPDKAKRAKVDDELEEV